MKREGSLPVCRIQITNEHKSKWLKRDEHMKPSDDVTAQAMKWAGQFLARYSTIPRSEILTYAKALRRKARTEQDPSEAAWCAAKAEALRTLLERQ